MESKKPQKSSKKTINYQKLLKDLNINKKFAPLFSPLKLIKLPTNTNDGPFEINLDNQT
jgi:hypothetical protein